MASKTFKTTIYRDGSMCFIPVPFDPRAVFGKVRAPVKVTLEGYTYRSTIAAMGGTACIPLRKSNREAAGLTGGETLEVTLELDTDRREVKAPGQGAEGRATALGALARAELQPSTRARGGHRGRQDPRHAPAGSRARCR